MNRLQCVLAFLGFYFTCGCKGGQGESSAECEGGIAVRVDVDPAMTVSDCEFTISTDSFEEVCTMRLPVTP